MPVTGHFIADFESFFTACQKAEISLKGVESGGEKVERSLARMADSFSGRKVIQEAGLMARIFHDAGGKAAFTTAELRRMGVVGAEAMEKIRRSGQPIPEQLMAMGRATRHLGAGASGIGAAAGKMDKFALSVGQADAMLGRFGVNLPPSVRGIADVGMLSVTAAGGITAFGAAALVAGTAFASWKLGEKIGEVTGWTDAIANATAKTLGWGDVAGQEAAAGQDVLARASKTAGRAITDQTEAMNINQQEAFALVDANTRTAASMQQLAADTKVAEAAMVALAEAQRGAQERSVRKEHELTVALMQREKDKEAAYAGMKVEGEERQKTQEEWNRSIREQEAAYAIQDSRNLQELDITRSQARSAAAAPTPRPAFAMRTPESYGAVQIPGGPAGAPAAVSASIPIPTGYGSAHGGATVPVTIHVSGVWDPASVQAITDAVSRELTRRGHATRKT